MKRLLLLRHAKSDWDASYGPDHERPLAKRGRRAADRIGRLMVEAELVPDLVVTSSAVRASETTRRAMKAGAWEHVPLIVETRLYGAGPETVFDVVRRTPDEFESVLLVGHEPGWSETVGLAIGRASVRMPTACLACIALGVSDWAQVGPGQGVLECLIPPRILSA